MAPKQFIDLTIYIVLLGSTVFVNKYVLSVLLFTYPTIFQGWQTLVGGVLLRFLLGNQCVQGSSSDLDKPGFISLLPSFLFFSAGVVASSKALSSLSVPMYICLHNMVGSVLHLIDIAPSFQSELLPLVGSIVTVITSMCAVLADIDMTFADSPYFWMFVSVTCTVVQSLHLKIADARYTDIDRLYYSYIFSVIVLAPASLYLEEAFQVLHFPNASRYDFYCGCFLSGVLALFLNLSLLRVRHVPYFASMEFVGRASICGFSFVLFSDSVTYLVMTFVFISLLSSVFVPLPKPAYAELMDDMSVLSK